MSDTGLTIDPATVFDNPADHQVEFAGSIDGESHRFAVRYAVLEALGATPPIDRPVAHLDRHRTTIERAALVALGRSDAQDRVIVTEADLAGSDPADAASNAAKEAEAHPS